MINVVYNYVSQQNYDQYRKKIEHEDTFCPLENIQRIMDGVSDRSISMIFPYIEGNIFFSRETKNVIWDVHVKSLCLWNRIRRLILRRVYVSRKPCNTIDLLGNPISEHDADCLMCMDNQRKYLFRHNDIHNIIQSSLSNSDDYLMANPLPIKNPYTGTIFSKNTLYLFYLRVKMPVLFIHFMEVNFDTVDFLLAHEGLLRHYAIKKKIKEMSPAKVYEAILGMLFDVSICQMINNSNCKYLGIRNKNLNVLKPLLHHYYNFLYSLNSYQREVEYGRLIKKLEMIN